MLATKAIVLCVWCALFVCPPACASQAVALDCNDVDKITIYAVNMASFFLEERELIYALQVDISADRAVEMANLKKGREKNLLL